MNKVDIIGRAAKKGCSLAYDANMSLLYLLQSINARTTSSGLCYEQSQRSIRSYFDSLRIMVQETKYRELNTE